MFQRKSAEEIVKTLILQDTFISGTPVFAGEVLELEKSVFYQLHEVVSRDFNGKEIRRAIAFKNATPEQLALTKKISKKEVVHS